MNDSVLHDSAVLAPPRRQTRSRKQVAAFAGALVFGVASILFGYRWWTTGRFLERTDDAYVGGNVTEISPHVGGFVTAILVSDNQYVEAGQELIRIDAADFDAAQDHAAATVQQREATLASLQAQTALQHSLIDQALADLQSRRADAAFAAQDAKRYRDLAMTKAGSGRDADKAQTADRTAQSGAAAAAARLDAARKQLAVLDASVKEAQAALTQSEAELQTARLNLGYTQIRSPIDGFIGDRSAQVGAYVTAGTHLLSIVPAHGLWVDANFKEDQIGRMRAGQPATVVVDVMPNQSFHGHLSSLAPATGAVFSVIPPQNATGNFTKIVQRVPVRIALDAGDAPLGLFRPGLSTTVRVDTRTQHAAP
ncbi:MAG TPA: HlyD family secretion protein [Steroidobacteraceae bacterium]|nr:HlyD family secretion protein [Steroidobacteraceae bacterium]